ncbi:MAG: class I SAM-dependent methyltransferase [Pirellulaceae bacterium]
MNQPSSDADYLHKEYPKQFAKDDFWKQIKRTVNGESVSEHDIHLIVDQVARHLEFSKNDHLLDLGCGNAALGSHLFDLIDRYTGVDFSEYLLEVAREYFHQPDKTQYMVADIRNTDCYVVEAASATKVLIYGCISYLTKTEVRELLTELRRSLPKLKTVFIGNIADRSKAADFFAARNIDDFSLNDPTSPIGVWWDQSEIADLVTEVGFSARCVSMPKEFYGGSYRFDIVLQSI